MLRTLDTARDGLTAAEASKRLATNGPNAIPHRPPPPWWLIFLRQLRSPIILILGLAAVVSVAIGHMTDAGFIAAVVAINSLIGGVQESRAERSALALRQLLRARAFVLRDGETTEIDAEDVVCGDAVWLEPGYRVPADGRLLDAHGLEVDESLLTGESLAVVKDPDRACPLRTGLADRRNMVFAGTIVTRGRGRAVIVETGAETEVGRLARDVLSAAQGKPPLLLRLARFSRVIAVGVVVASVAIALIGVGTGRHTLTDMFLFGVALAVAAIPEGLPVAITVALAVASTRMARRSVIVRRLDAVEGLGSCTLIASDKTGTLTCNELTVREIRLPGGEVLAVSGEGFAPHGAVTRNGRDVHRDEIPALDELMVAAVLCNEGDLHRRESAWSWHGDPTDVALLSVALKAGWRRSEVLDDRPQVNAIPFEPEHRFAATFHDRSDGTHACVKGAPERVWSMCDDAADETGLLEVAAEMAGRGLRVLAFASGRLPDRLAADDAAPTPSGLTFRGLVGMIDPLRPEVRAAVEACQRSGIRVCMVTGDHPVTALAIARELGFAEREEEVVTGAELASMDDAALAERVARSRVFARVAPHQKLDIVQAAQRSGHFVAVTGDGVNDAPALRAANIGVAMGRSGTDVARESADLVVTDDNFASIVAGIEEGRVAYDNIRKVILLLVATGAAEVLVVGLAVAAGLPLPLLPVQILWLNLVTNGIQDVALAFEPDEGDVLERRPRPPRERIFDGVMLRNTLVASVLVGVAGFLAFRWMLANGASDAAARNGLLLLMVLFENVLIGNCRSETKPALGFSPLRSPFLLVGALGAFLLHVAMMHLPLGRRILGTEPVPVRDWVVFALLALAVFALIELQKWLFRPRSPRQPAPSPQSRGA
ncbi:MAG: HAD-IC family P-type ATPase [Phycisphaerales bacterium]|nr:HAD-IC family P-type ATPase [Phycisphaerales bacterium]